MKFYRQADRVAARIIDGAAFIVSVDQQELIELNEVGTFVWATMTDPIGVEKIAAAVTSEFQVEHERALRDVEGFVESLLACQAIVAVEPGAE